MHQLSPSLFHGRHFDRSIIILCVRWYVTDKLRLSRLGGNNGRARCRCLSYDYPEMGQRYVPAFEKRLNYDARPVGTSWRVDETYIKVRGRWNNLYRAVDQQGLTIDFLLSEYRDIAAAKRFFTRAAKQHGTPETITLDGYPATQAAVAELKKSGVLRPQTKIVRNEYAHNLKQVPSKLLNSIASG